MSLVKNPGVSRLASIFPLFHGVYGMPHGWGRGHRRRSQSSVNSARKPPDGTKQTSVMCLAHDLPLPFLWVGFLYDCPSARSFSRPVPVSDPQVEQVINMSVELLDTTRFHGFRVRRQIAGKTFQEYFSLKENGKRIRGAARARVKAVAEERDAVLKKKQDKARAEAARSAVFGKDGNVRGILFRLKTEKSGTRTPVFQIGIMSTKAGKIVNTTVSINLHGLAGAWQKAVDFYADHKQISKRAKLYKELLKACPSKAELDAMKRRRRRRR